jgi:flagellar export protein FliJ
MKTFTFRLETLLQLRKNARDRALSDYADSIRDRESAEEEVQRAEGYLERLNVKLLAKSQNIFLGKDMLDFQEQIQKAKNTKSDLKNKLSRLSSIESSRRKVFIQKEAEFKSLDNYKLRMADEHIVFETNKEEKAQEDIITSRFVYNRAHS